MREFSDNSNLVSVIMPVFNSEKFLQKSINSVLGQSNIDLELILIDDCSTDCSSTIIDKYTSLFSNIKAIKTNQNSGAGVSRNAGISIARGRYIAFIDSDDIWHENKLSIQLDVMSKKRAAICHTSYSMIDELDCTLSGGVNASCTVDLLKYMNSTEIGLSTAVIDRQIIQDIHFDNARTRQDTMLWLRLLGNGYVSIGINKSLVKYRIRKGQISKNKIKMLYQTFLVFISVKQISLIRRLSSFLMYAINGLAKRFL